MSSNHNKKVLKQEAETTKPFGMREVGAY